MTSNGFTNRSRSNTGLRIFQLDLDAQKIDLFANQPKNACHHTINVMGMMIAETTVTKSKDALVIEKEFFERNVLHISNYVDKNYSQNLSMYCNLNF